jgi:4-hydroxy-3-polyprenylbenzoate decarboxylase
VDATREGIPSGREHYSVINVNKTYPGEAMDRLKERLGNSEDKFVIAVDGNVDKEDISLVMWKLFNNIDGKRDLITYGSGIGIDATKKWKEEGITREWPEDILMSEDIKKLVSRRWEEYGLD